MTSATKRIAQAEGSLAKTAIASKLLLSLPETFEFFYHITVSETSEPHRRALTPILPPIGSNSLKNNLHWHVNPTTSMIDA